MPFRYISRRAQVIRSFYSGIGKTAVIYPATLLTSVSIGILIFGTLFYLKAVFAASESLIGLNAALWSFSYIIGCLLLRPLSERIPPRYVLTGATFFMAVFVLGMLKAPWLWLVITCNCLVALSMAHFWPLVMGWLSGDLAGGELSRVMSRFNLSWSTGTIISPWLAGWLTEQGPTVPLYTAAGLLLLTAAMLFGAALTLPRLREEKTVTSEHLQKNAGTGRGTPLRFPAWVGIFAAFMIMGLTGYIFPPDAKDRLHLVESTIGLLLLARAVTSTAMFAFMGQTRFWHNRPTQMVAGTIGIAVFLFIMPACTRPLTIAPAFAFFGILSAQAYFNSLFHGLENCSNRAARSALHEALLNGGIIAGALLGGVISDHFSMNTAYRVFAGIIAVAAAVQIVLVLWLPNRRGPQVPCHE